MQDRFEIFTKLISRISRNIRRIKTEGVAEFNLKSPHVSCLYYLHKKRKLCAKKIADMCDEDKAAVSRSIDYLEDVGYVIYDNESGRRYKADLVLTPRGEEVAAEIVEKIDRVISLAGSDLTEEERRIFYLALEKISNNLDKINKN